MRRATGSIIVLAWLGATLTGLGLLASHAGQPGASGLVPQEWPAESNIPRASDRPTLVMFAHPRCPCTRASLAELSKVVARQPEVAVRIVFYRPTAPDSESWEQTDQVRAAAGIPGALVHWDIDGVEAQRFGAQTSGQALLFGPGGNLLFHGGLTPARGHVGDNLGSQSLTALLDGATSVPDCAPVFGCGLQQSAPVQRETKP
ncbi:MAG: hypothetical protein K2Y37_08335 [Pirellulales bacterium]|nr:hypothetical protein [Pirellulales bacterium]